MWEIENRSPFPATGGFQRDQNGKSFWCVWIACDFNIRPSRPPLFLTAQTAPLIAPKFVDDDPTCLLLSDSETCLSKPGVDFTIAADGYPPGDEAFSAQVNWADGWQKQLVVHPPHVWNRWGRTKRVDQPFEPVPLDWTASVRRRSNPLGTQVQFENRKASRGQSAPQLTTDASPLRIENLPPPASLMPVPRAWPQRSRLGGTYDEAWQRNRAPLLPSDLSSHYWQSAPNDQVLDREMVMHMIRIGTPIETVNMIADGRFDTLVPDLQFDMSVYFKGGWHDMDCDLQSIHIDLRAMIMRQVWMGQFSIAAAHFDVALDRTHISLRSVKNMVVGVSDAARFSQDSIGREAMSA